eukprot:TRINITY_DN14941_c0_g1_i1.p1 TRINITY_DN14941_c0_g1~~TRINITY_DN14941_c0_g1_i1.p1  ORF type:complete len:355 (-),score=58.62 TRINITY_DN14941_c0_g1_i1:9-1073(-)
MRRIIPGGSQSDIALFRQGRKKETGLWTDIRLPDAPSGEKGEILFQNRRWSTRVQNMMNFQKMTMKQIEAKYSDEDSKGDILTYFTDGVERVLPIDYRLRGTRQAGVSVFDNYNTFSLDAPWYMLPIGSMVENGLVIVNDDPSKGHWSILPTPITKPGTELTKYHDLLVKFGGVHPKGQWISADNFKEKAKLNFGEGGTPMSKSHLDHSEKKLTTLIEAMILDQCDLRKEIKDEEILADLDRDILDLRLLLQDYRQPNPLASWQPPKFLTPFFARITGYRFYSQARFLEPRSPHWIQLEQGLMTNEIQRLERISKNLDSGDELSPEIEEAIADIQNEALQWRTMIHPSFLKYCQ